MKDLSFIVPIYHTPQDAYLRCLDGFQSISKDCQWEVIVIDDGNEEDVIDAIVSTRYDKRYKVIRQANMGLSGARNTGIEQAQGRYVIFVDADDRLRFPEFNSLLPQILSGEFDLVGYRYQPTSIPPYQGNAATFMAMQDISPSACTYAIRRELLTDLRFTPVIYHEDEEFSTKLHLLADRILVTPTVAYEYTFNPESITNKKEKAHILRRLSDLAGIIDRLNGMPLDGICQKAVIRRIHVLAMCYVVEVIRARFTLKDTRQALHGLRQLQLYPLPAFKGIRRYKTIRLLTSSPWLVWLCSRLLSRRS